MKYWQRVVKYLSIALAFTLAASIILGGITLMGRIFGFKRSKILDEPYSIALSQNIENIDICVSAAKFKIVLGDRFSLLTDIEDLNATSNSTLSIIQPENVFTFGSNSAGEIILTVPHDARFKSFTLDTGTGEVDIEYLNAESVEIDMGAGNFSLHCGVIGGLNIDLGAGNTDFKAMLNGNCKIDVGVGKVDLNIIGHKSDYRINIDQGVGSIIVDDERITEDTVIGDGKYKIEVDGGVGSIDINFVNE
jgi:hypothetical protein